MQSGQKKISKFAYLLRNGVLFGVQHKSRWYGHGIPPYMAAWGEMTSLEARVPMGEISGPL